MVSMMSGLIAQIGLPMLSRVVGAGLERLSHPTAQAAADGLQAVERAIADGEIAPDRVAAATADLDAIADRVTAADRMTFQDVNQIIRADRASEDAYVRRMRPTFGYLMALSWAGQMGAIGYVIVTDPGGAGDVIAAMSNLTVIWAVGLSVLGVYVYKRSEDKRLGGGSGDGAGLAGAFRSVVDRMAGRPTLPD